MKKFLVISRCEDEAYLHFYTEQELKKLLDSGEYASYKFLNQSDWHGDLMEFPGNSILIFRGETVIPKPVQKVVEYSL